MITLLILGVLVTIVVMTMLVSKSKAQQAACKANLRIIDSALQQYRSLHDGETPPNVVDGTGQVTQYGLDTLMDEGYIKGSFGWKCPSGQYDYRVYYDDEAGQTSCPLPDHNP